MTAVVDAPIEAPVGAPRKPPVWPVVLLILTVGLVSLTLGALVQHALSSWVYERAHAEYAAVQAVATDTADDYAALLERAELASTQVEELELVAAPAYADATALASLADASDALASTLERAPDAELAPRLGILDPDEHAGAPWDRYADAARLLEVRELRDGEVAELDSASSELSTARANTVDARMALFAALAASGEQALADHPSASHVSRIDLRHAIDQSGGAWGHPKDSAGAFTATVAAIEQLRASHAAEEARRLEHPLRAEIEAFARSIAAGVELEFVWAYEVAGLSSDEWYSGTAEFMPDDDDGWGRISLTESIEREWHADENAKAVVVHEVGHTQVLRDACYAIFTAEPFGGDHEMWATAWAIGMGYDLPGAGIEAYGRPSDAQVAAAAGCR